MVNGVAVATHDHIEPATATSSAGRDAKFTSDFLQLFTDGVVLFGRKGTRAHAGAVGFYDADDGLYGGWVES